MVSRHAAKKDAALRMRRAGLSIRTIEVQLSIPRSTLSGWFRDISLTPAQQARLRQERDRGLVQARKQAVRWHNAQKEARLREAELYASELLKRVKRDPVLVELALAFLYLGEGTKTNDQTALGSSDPRIARFFVQALRKQYRVPLMRIKCYLHLRADQDPAALTRYWSRQLGVPITNFGKPSIDLRTAGRPTLPRYKGVCAIYAGTVAIQRRLLYIANGFCDSYSADAKRTGRA
jgi:hypothetical protein